MKKTLVIVACVAIAALASVAAPATASPIVVTKKFANCKALNRVYPGGVARSGSVSNSGGATKYSPTVSSRVYKENKSKDRDHDGIACER
jgi:hypothetical protein